MKTGGNVVVVELGVVVVVLGDGVVKRFAKSLVRKGLSCRALAVVIKQKQNRSLMRNVKFPILGNGDSIQLIITRRFVAKIDQ